MLNSVQPPGRLGWNPQYPYNTVKRTVSVTSNLDSINLTQLLLTCDPLTDHEFIKDKSGKYRAEVQYDPSG